MRFSGQLLCRRGVGVAAAQQPTFRAGVTLVTTDVIPRDSNGRFVADLTQRELHGARGRPAAGRSCRFTMVQRRPHLQPAGAAAAAVRGARRPGAAAAEAACRRQRRPRAADLHRRSAFRAGVVAARPPASMQTIGDTLMHEGDLVTVAVERAVVHRDRSDLRQEGRHRSGRQDSRLGSDPVGDLQDARDLAGPGDIRVAGADGVLHGLPHPRRARDRSTTGARP